MRDTVLIIAGLVVIAVGIVYLNQHVDTGCFFGKCVTIVH